MALNKIQQQMLEQKVQDKLNKVDEHTMQLAERALHVKGVGNGITDDTQAFADTLALSDVVYVPRGKTYLIGDVDITGKVIFGDGVIKKKASSESAFHVKGDGSRIEGLTFLGESTSGQPSSDIKLGDGAKNITISSCYFQSPVYSAISGSVDTGVVGGALYVNYVDGVVISNNVFKGYARPLFLHSIKNITISNNIIRDTSYDAIRLRENDGYCLINGNQIINAGMKDVTFDTNGNPVWIDAQTRDAVDVYWSGNNLTITNNIIKTTACMGLDIKGVAPDGSYGSSKVIISNNQIYKTRFSGIVVYGSSDYDGLGAYRFADGVVITENIVQECNQDNKNGLGTLTEAGIHLKSLVSYATVSDNYVISNYSHGIYVHNSDAGKAMCRGIRVTGNLCVNNGHSAQTGVGISTAGVDGLIVSENICENDTSLFNPQQKIGIQQYTVDNGYTSPKSVTIKGNIVRNNLSDQIVCGATNNRADSILVFENNLQVGTQSGNYRQTWQVQRSVFFGVAIPSANEGTFRQGDIIFNSSAIASGKVGWVCVSGGNPGTWKPFGAIDA